MMANETADESESFIISARTLRGSKREMVQDIDQAIVGLLALRHLIDGGATPPGTLAPGGRRPILHRFRWPRLFTTLRPFRLARQSAVSPSRR
jgi:hypothetical protein